jgi:steroid delta-isomerase-like uncharacterized protein
MSTEQNKISAHHFIEQGFNQKNPLALEAFFSPSLIDHALPPMLPPGFEGRKMFYGAFISAFPDVYVQVQDQVAEGNKVVTYWAATGTHNGELMGIPATGRSVTVGGIAIDRFEDGKSVEHWEIFDQMSLMQQLGVVPMPGSA